MTLDHVDQLTASGPLVLAMLVSVVAGFVSFASPCVVPLVPGYLSYLAAIVGVEEHQPGLGTPSQIGEWRCEPRGCGSLVRRCCSSQASRRCSCWARSRCWG